MVIPAPNDVPYELAVVQPYEKAVFGGLSLILVTFKAYVNADDVELVLVKSESELAKLAVRESELMADIEPAILSVTAEPNNLQTDKVLSNPVTPPTVQLD